MAKKIDDREGFRALLLKALGKAAYDEATKSFDVMGDTAVIDAGPKTARKVAGALMRSNPRIATVLRKGGAVGGEYRTRKYHYVSGRRSFVVEHRENGCVFRFDIRKVYFSPRLSFERSRVVGASRDGENVVDMFAGVGPYSIQIAKSHKRSTVVASELNKAAYECLVENARLNKAGNVVPVLGDAKKLVHGYTNFADRIIMNLPMSSFGFLDDARKIARKRCVVHYYAFGSIDDPFAKQSEMLKTFFARHKKRIKIISKRVVRNYSAKEVEIALDFRIE